MTTETNALAIVEQVTATPALVLNDEKAYSSFYSAMEEEVRSHVPDLTTEKGRKEIASLAYKVTRTKTTIDNAGKLLTEEAREHINKVNESRKKIREELEALAETARKPLTDWEEAEKKRVEGLRSNLAYIERLGQGYIGDDVAQFNIILSQLEVMEENPEKWGDYLPEATRAINAARTKILEAQENARVQAEKDAELENLRAFPILRVVFQHRACVVDNVVGDCRGKCHKDD